MINTSTCPILTGGQATGHDLGTGDLHLESKQYNFYGKYLGGSVVVFRVNNIIIF